MNAPVAPVVRPEPTAIANVAPIVAFLKAANERGLRFPKLRVLDADGSSELLLYLSGARSRVPGSVVVKRNGNYLGVVRPTGEVFSSQVPVDRLAAVAENPAEAARSFAALSGRCSFCNLPLTDAGSVEVGYGPVCARHWGLPHTPQGTPDLNGGRRRRNTRRRARVELNTAEAYRRLYGGVPPSMEAELATVEVVDPYAEEDYELGA
jgi:hypothetical protein